MTESYRAMLDIETRDEGFEIAQKTLVNGGMSLLYLALDVHSLRTVTVKLPTINLSANPEEQTRFLFQAKREAMIQQRLSANPNIMPVYAFFFAAIRNEKQVLVHPAMVTEYFDPAVSFTLARQIYLDPLAPAKAVGICQKIANALDYCRENGVAHGDVKPGNIMLAADGSELSDMQPRS